MATSTFSSNRIAWREAVAAVAAAAKAKLPAAVNGRVESAVKLVLAGDVFFLDDGTVEVGSSSDASKTYTLAGHACDCQDYAYGKAPDGWCQHRLAAAIQKRVGAMLAAQPASAPMPGPLPCPEAAFSLTLKGTLDGQEALLTARGQTVAEFTANLQSIRGVLDTKTPVSQGQGLSAQQDSALAQHKQITGYCAVHEMAMTLNRKDGKTWYSHRLPEGGFCKGKVRQ